MTIKDLKELIKTIPDDYEVRIHDRAYGDVEIEEAWIQTDDKKRKVIL